MNKMKFNSISTTLLLTSVLMLPNASHANFLDKLNKGLGKVGQVLGTVSGTTSSTQTASKSSDSVFADASDEQVEQIVKVAMTRSGVPEVDKSLDEAKENIAQMMLLASCSDNWNLNFGAIQSPDEQMMGWKGVLSRMPYHPKDRCATAQSMGGFKKPAQNILEFKVIYSSTISGEASTCQVRLRDQYGTGNWLVAGHACGWN